MSNNFTQKNKKTSIFLTLDRAKPQKFYEIVRCLLPNDKKLRFFEMGLVPGATVTLLQVAPLGDPLEIFVKGYSMCIRTKDAKGFVVEEML